MLYPPPLPGKVVSLQPITLDDFTVIHQWITDPQVIPFWHGKDKVKDMNWVVNHFTPMVNGTDPSLCFIIQLHQTPIGYMYNTPMKNDEGVPTGVIEIDILIGDPNQWGKGYGSAALRTMLKYAFHTQGAERVFLTPRLGNDRAIHLYEKVGFKKEGILRHYEKFEEKWIDCLMMSIIRTEYEAPTQ